MQPTMKKILPVVLVLLSVVAQAQVNLFVFNDGDSGKVKCDTLQYVVSYDMTYVDDSTKYDPKTELMQLEIGKRCTKFYSYERMQMDSVMEARVRQGNYDFNDLAGGNIEWELYKGHPKEGHTTWLQSVGSNRFMVVEPITMPEWQLDGDSTMDILGYKCHQATANFKGRRWTVWYAEDIPLGEGPWLLAGLPGLVLRAYDLQQHYVFEAKGMRQVKDESFMTYSGNRYEEISRREFNREIRRYKENVIAYLKDNPQMKVTITGADGVPLSSLKEPYNPIERE